MSYVGLTRPLEDIALIPVAFITNFFNDVSQDMTVRSSDTDDIEELKRRNAELERALARIESEVIQLREIASDYERLTALLDYTTATESQTFVTADVIGVDQQSNVRSIILNRGTRDGISVGMPVVTEKGLVGRILDVSANISRVQLVSDENSAVSGRLQSSRAEGSIRGRGLLTGNLRMEFIPIDTDVIEGDLVVTSGLGGNFPPDIVIGQVSSSRNFEFELYQEAEVLSLIDFTKLEFVLVVTSFEPADISIFDEET